MFWPGAEVLCHKVHHWSCCVPQVILSDGAAKLVSHWDLCSLICTDTMILLFFVLNMPSDGSLKPRVIVTLDRGGFGSDAGCWCCCQGAAGGACPHRVRTERRPKELGRVEPDTCVLAITTPYCVEAERTLYQVQSSCQSLSMCHANLQPVVAARCLQHVACFFWVHCLTRLLRS